jgi:hypothetical protein
LKKKAEPLLGSAFFFLQDTRRRSDGASATNEVHDDRYQGKDQQEMDEEAADVKNEKSTQPKQN